jgi:hypothetical protein
MKIYTRVVIDMATSNILEADWYDYDGPVAQCKKGGKAPKTPDPNVVSAAQTQSNQQTAAYNAALNRTNTYTPQGSSEFTQTGTDASGAPIYRQDVTLTPDAQALYDQQQGQSRQLGNIAGGMMDTIGSAYANPIDTSGAPKAFGAEDLQGERQQVQDALYKRQTAYLDPQWQQRDTAFQSGMANKGIVEGSEAWKNALDDQNRARSFDYAGARDAAIIGGRGEMSTLSDISRANRGLSLDEMYRERAQPLNEFNALRSSSQVDMPQFAGAAPVTMANTDVAGNTWNAFDASMAKYNADQAASNNLMGGMFGLGSAAITAAPFMMSDERLKEDIQQVGKLPSGPNVYEYTMKPTGERQVGVMAQEVEQTQPDAVVTDPASGYKKVNYGTVLAKAMQQGGRRGS